MCRKIRYDGESCKVLGFWMHLNKDYADLNEELNLGE